MGRRSLTEGRIQLLKNQTSLGLEEEKIWENRKVALARYKISGKLTRQIVKTLIVRGQKCDVYNEGQKVRIVDIAGPNGYNDAGGDTYKAGKQEIEKMAGDGLLIELVKGEKAVFYNLFAGKILYDDIGHYFVVSLNPLLKPYYNKITSQFTVLMLSEYLRLSFPFYKDLYEWLSAYQGKSVYTFSVSLEKFCKHFNCEKSLKGHRNDVYNRVMKAKTEIEALTELRFDVTPHYEGGGKIRKGTLDKLIFTVNKSPYYETQELKQEEARKLREEKQQQEDTFASLLEFNEGLKDLGSEKNIQQAEIASIEKKIIKEREERAKEDNTVAAGATSSIDEISDEMWERLLRENNLRLEDLAQPEEEEQESFAYPEDDLTEEDEEQARQEMEETMLNDPVYGDMYREAKEMEKMENEDDGEKW